MEDFMVVPRLIAVEMIAMPSPLSAFLFGPRFCVFERLVPLFGGPLHLSGIAFVAGLLEV
jgi:hypothetical protein